MTTLTLPRYPAASQPSPKRAALTIARHFGARSRRTAAHKVGALDHRIHVDLGDLDPDAVREACALYLPIGMKWSVTR